jgi:uncharacterized protein (TIGR02145 family)
MTTKKLSVLLCALLTASIISCSEDSPPETTTGPGLVGVSDSTLTDFEGNIYQTIRIGDQIWLAENLKTKYTYSGDLLSGVHAYNDNEDYVEEYGRLYAWETAKDACPTGWRLPSISDWNALISNIGSDAADKLKEGGVSGFNVKMAGRLSGESYGYLGALGTFWSSTESDSDHATVILIVNNESDVIIDNTLRAGGLSVRYIKD